MPGPHGEEGPVVLDRRQGPYGEVVLRRHGRLLQIIANGCFLMDTSDGRSERLLVSAALDTLLAHGGPAGPVESAGPLAPAGPTGRTGPTGPAPGEAEAAERRAPTLLIGGLGVGFSLAEAAAEPRWGRIDVVEREPAVLDWHRAGPLAEVSAGALADPRVRLIEADLLATLRTAGRRYDALCLDIDNGPDWQVTSDNEDLYSPAGLAACRAALADGGVLAVWSARPSEEFVKNLHKAGFTGVHTREVPVARGVPDVLFLASHHLARQTA
ncbi:spermidine synthase [Streptomyces hoynatensis]|uniref:Spermidine synthase n=1 Tax=Streptomyces hoynatensis TaxID=1141874 RepID=A0A3A9YWX5_9ACTN|nr:spermidine synthase [Streptomyces hoynatensis]